MKAELGSLLLRFREIHGVSQLELPELYVEFEFASHTRPSTLKDEIGVYAFFREGEWLRIGQTSYPQRFTSQHYGTRRANSTFAKDIWMNRTEFGYLGLEDEIGEWIFSAFGRANIRLPRSYGDTLSKLLEAFLHLNLKPRFEGRRSI
ncbi:hypothetical protein Q9K01_13835 [Qipengyuania sp. DY56-A-20]|jgi:hypothetical protein|uniref:Uncharacterized protein n=1 Tax=Qipengyuania benthica TaxID=3067651 RepID=A0ABT9HBK6_9SPHN|nr:hypothetical protein [Qipengyuania sp. DY56-A-20]MDP4540708.1 hypothetical protein [Qipengyuania sp. DY56-A-20]